MRLLLVGRPADVVKPALETQDDPGYAGDVEETPERAPSVPEEGSATQAKEKAEEPAPSPAEPAGPKADDAKSGSSGSSEHTAQPLSDVAKGKRKCVDFASSEDEILFNFSHQRSFPLVRNKSLSGLPTHPLERTKTAPPASLDNDEGESSRPPRSVLEAIGLSESEWDESIVAPGLQFIHPSSQIGAVTEPVGDVQKPAAIGPEPVGDVPESAVDLPQPAIDVTEPVGDVPEPASDFPEPAGNVRESVSNPSGPAGDVPELAIVASKPDGDAPDHVYDLPEPAGNLSTPLGTPPTMSGALPVPAGSQPEPIDSPKSAEVAKVSWPSFLLRKLRNALLPKPILQLLLGREIADQTKSALQMHASGAA